MSSRPRRIIRALAIVAGGATGGLVALAVPANAVATVSGTVSAGGGLNARSGPTTNASRLSVVANNSRVAITCQSAGMRISGQVRTTDQWDRLSNGWWVSDAYIKRTSTVPACSASGGGGGGSSGGGTPSGAWVAPVNARVISGFRTPQRPDHDGTDLGAGRGTPIRAAAAGTVVTVLCNTSGTTCDVNGGISVRGCGWYLEIRHANNVVTRYCHLVRRPSVSVGQKVNVGQTIGNVGSSGNSTGPHLHFEVHSGYSAVRANAVDPVDFMRRARAPLG